MIDALNTAIATGNTMDPIGAALIMFDALNSVIPKLTGPIITLTCVGAGYVLIGNILSGRPWLYIDIIKLLKGLQFMIVYGIIMFTMVALYGSLTATM